MLALCLRAVLILSPDTWDWTRMHALAVKHRWTLCENVDSAKIKVTFYTTDIDILHVASMHCIAIHRIVSIYRSKSMNRYTPTTCTLDPIPSHLLQVISPAVVPALTHIFNTSLHTGLFPSAFKQACITPLLKKPTLNPTLLGNYRPVFLLPFIGKTLERVVFNQVTAFLTQNNLLDSNQAGFRSVHSTKTALLSVVEDIRLARTASKSSLLILLDLSAAFDTDNHQIRSYCQPYWERASQELHSSGLSLTSPIGPSKYLGDVRYPSRNI